MANCLARETMWPARLFSCPLSGLQVNTVVFQEISMCVIFFSVMLPFFMELRQLFKD